MQLSSEIIKVAHILFPEDSQEEVISILQNDCGKNVLSSNYQNEIERIQLAALKMSNGEIESLYSAIALAQTDWRDLLMAAGFGENVKSHISWAKGFILASKQANLTSSRS